MGLKNKITLISKAQVIRNEKEEGQNTAGF